ncbi:hypothetical protein Tco_1343545 [Tanacetum coccineum]
MIWMCGSWETRWLVLVIQSPDMRFLKKAFLDIKPGDEPTGPMSRNGLGIDIAVDLSDIPVKMRVCPWFKFVICVMMRRIAKGNQKPKSHSSVVVLKRRSVRYFIVVAVVDGSLMLESVTIYTTLSLENRSLEKKVDHVVDGAYLSFRFSICCGSLGTRENEMEIPLVHQ